MKILCVLGSPSTTGNNKKLLVAIQKHLSSTYDVTLYDQLHEFTLFTPERLENGTPDTILQFRKMVVEADAVIISAPEYSHNIPATLKNMFEWCTASGEFDNKRTYALVFMPQEPRGKLAMESLVNTLKGVKARIVTELPLFLTDVRMQADELELLDKTKELISGMMEVG
ncbi:MAG: NAD(P)H-dependent oxidoreductase [Crocinitomicaceae bacterium]|nr:NAD(P)H-dependent oxidoreductase [Crocinitomicaceae bacterium]